MGMPGEVVREVRRKGIGWQKVSVFGFEGIVSNYKMAK